MLYALNHICKIPSILMFDWITGKPWSVCSLVRESAHTLESQVPFLVRGAYCVAVLIPHLSHIDVSLPPSLSKSQWERYSWVRINKSSNNKITGRRCLCTRAGNLGTILEFCPLSRHRKMLCNTAFRRGHSTQVTQVSKHQLVNYFICKV